VNQDFAKVRLCARVGTRNFNAGVSRRALRANAAARRGKKPRKAKVCRMHEEK
jgi:hypothetical protein